MARETFTKEQFWAELDELGEEQVRVNLDVTKIYGDVGSKRALALEWLRRRDQSRSETSNREQMRIARSAKNAAWIAAIAAIVAAIIAAVAAVMSYLSLK